MRNITFFLGIILALNAVNGQSIVHPGNNEAFIQNEIAEVHIQLHPNDLISLLNDSLYSDYHFPATFEYFSSNYSDTIQNVGFRVRGILLEMPTRKDLRCPSTNILLVKSLRE